MNDIITAVSYEESIIQLKISNAPKHPTIIAKIFRIIADCDVNIDMISQVSNEEGVTLAITLDEKYQKNLNEAIMKLKEEIKQLEISTSRKYFKIAVGGRLVETTPGIAAKVFEVLGKNNIHFYQVTTSKRTISFIIDKEDSKKAVEELDKVFNIGG